MVCRKLFGCRIPQVCRRSEGQWTTAAIEQSSMGDFPVLSSIFHWFSIASICFHWCHPPFPVSWSYCFLFRLGWCGTPIKLQWLGRYMWCKPWIQGFFTEFPHSVPWSMWETQQYTYHLRMVYTTHLRWFWGGFIIGFTTLTMGLFRYRGDTTWYHH